MKEFAIKLKELREEKGLTQKELAKEIEQAQSAVCYWEANEREPNITALKKIACYFNVTADYLLGLENDDGSKYDIHHNQIGTMNLK